MDAVTLADLLSPGSLLTNLYFVFLNALLLHSALKPKSRFRSEQVFLLTLTMMLLMQLVPLLLYRFYAIKIILYISLTTSAHTDQ